MPTGVKLRDGLPTLIILAAAPNIALWETNVQPPGADMGEKNDQTTMRNLIWTTAAPPKLKDLTPMTGDAEYDPKVLTDIMNQLGANQLIVVQHSNGAFWTFWGYLKSAIPSRNSRNRPPMLDFVFQPTNQDNSGAEVAPTYTAPSSTSATTTTTLA